jgi:hypothetical protein
VKIEPTQPKLEPRCTPQDPDSDSEVEFVQITRKEKVKKVVELAEVPFRWPVPEVDTAYIVPVDTKSGLSTTGKQRNLDSILKSEVRFCPAINVCSTDIFYV